MGAKAKNSRPAYPPLFYFDRGASPCQRRVDADIPVSRKSGLDEDVQACP